jgi:hypothetical protein
MEDIFGLIGALVGMLIFAFILPFFFKAFMLLLYFMIEACAFLYNYSAHLVNL